MAKWMILFPLSILYAHITICCLQGHRTASYKWISSLPTFEEPNSEPLSHIVESRNHVFVAGRNVLYRLGHELDSPLKFATGPEPDHPQCFLDRPCDFKKQMTDNENQVLMDIPYLYSDGIDSHVRVLYEWMRPQLLMCGSLYHGLCQIRDMGNISEYRWIKPYNGSLGFPSIRPSPYRKTWIIRTVTHNAVIWWSALHDDPVVRTPSSPHFLSKKVIVEEDNDLRFELMNENTDRDSTLKFEGNATRYVLHSFNDGFIVYFVIVHTSGEGKITTRIGRVCHSVQSYTEMVIACEHKGRKHDRATAVYYGLATAKIRLDYRLKGLPLMLYVALASYEGDELRGQTLAGFSMQAVKKSFASGESSCLAAQDPIEAVDCHSSRKYTHPAYLPCGKIDYPRLMNQPFMSNIVLGYIGWPMSPYSFTISAIRIQEQHGVGIVVFGTSHGFIFKANMEQRKIYAFTSLLDENESKAPVISPLTPGKNGTHIYVVIKNKVVKYPLYSCSPHQSCPRCIGNGNKQDPLGCVWCNGKCTLTTECKDSTTLRNDSCPPEMEEVTYEYYAVKKATVITISGVSFGLYINSSYNNVTVANLDCEVETWNDTQITCILTTPPKRESIPTVRLSTFNWPPSNKIFEIFGELNLTQYRIPKLYAMFPSKGPTSGGTHVILYGENLDAYENRIINVRGRYCREIAINNHAAWCTTDQTASPELNDTIAFQFGNNILELEEDVPDSFNLTGKYRNFTYLPDPQIYQIQPGITTISGLMNVTVVGRHLDSVETPEMVVRVALSQSENVLEFKEACWSDPESAGRSLTCRSPPLRHPGVPLPTRTFPLVTHVGFLMDGLEELRDLDRTREVMSRLMYYPDPEITPFRSVMKIRDNETVLEIKGRHLDLLNNLDNLHVRIGDSDLCKIISLHPSSLQCELPTMLLSNASILGNNFTVEVVMGVSSKNVGILSLIENQSFETPIWMFAAIIGGSCIAVGILVWYCLCFKKKNKKSLEDLALAPRNESGNQYARTVSMSSPRQANPSQDNLTVTTSHCEEPLIATTPPCKEPHITIPKQPLITIPEKPLITIPKQPLIAIPEQPLVERETLQLIKEEGLLIDFPLLTIGQEIGAGQFGCVYEGLLRRSKDSTRTKVAVKTLRRVTPQDASENIADFLEEALVMKDFKHPNVLSLIGISFEKGLPLVVLPYMTHRDLCKYLRDETIKGIMKVQLLQFAIDVANGMAYLAKTRFVHRDLAARNCVMDSQLNVYVADFGLSRDIYEKEYYSSQDRKKKLPCKWMALESLELGTYSVATDVWSYGVLLWELMTRGRTPYPSVIGWDVLPYLKSGRRLSRPEKCPEDLYALMLECWNENQDKRPCFEEIRDRVSRISTELIDEEQVNPTTAAQNPGYL